MNKLKTGFFPEKEKAVFLRQLHTYYDSLCIQNGELKTSKQTQHQVPRLAYQEKLFSCF